MGGPYGEAGEAGAAEEEAVEESRVVLELASDAPDTPAPPSPRPQDEPSSAAVKGHAMAEVSRRGGRNKLDPSSKAPSRFSSNFNECAK